MSRSLAIAAAALLSLACADGPATATVVPLPAAPATRGAPDTAAPGMDAAGAASLRERALGQAPAGVSAHVTVQCEDPAAWCGYETIQPDNENLAELLSALEQACQEGGGCSVFLESITAGEDGQKHARIALHATEAVAAAPAAPLFEAAPGALDEPTATRVVADVRAALAEPLRDDLHLRCTPELGCSLRTEQVDNESVAQLLSALNDRCEQTDPPACAVWLTDLYQHPENGRKVADIALTTAD